MEDVNLLVNFLHLSSNSKFLRVLSSLSNTTFSSSLPILSETKFQEMSRLLIANNYIVNHAEVIKKQIFILSLSYDLIARIFA